MRIIEEIHGEFNNLFWISLIPSGENLYVFIEVMVPEEEKKADLDKYIIPLDKVFQKLFDHGLVNIIFSLRNIYYIGDIGQSIILSYASDFKNQGGSMFMCDTSPANYTIMEFLGWKEILTIYSTREQLFANLF